MHAKNGIPSMPHVVSFFLLKGCSYQMSYFKQSGALFNFSNSTLLVWTMSYQTIIKSERFRMSRMKQACHCHNHNNTLKNLYFQWQYSTCHLWYLQSLFSLLTASTMLFSWLEIRITQEGIYRNLTLIYMHWK